MKTHFLLARHGQTQWNLLKKLQGRLDSEITETGYQQAQQLAETLASKPASKSVDLIVTSPLPRASITANICQQKLQCPIQTNEGLIERHFGDWQSQLFDDLGDQPYFSEIFFQVTEHAPPNGESGIDCANRFKQALIEIATKNPQKAILIVTHGDAIRCFSTQLKQVAFCDAYSQYGNGSVIATEFDHQLEKFEILL
ncbi:MAG: histidine phosphatase family protein [Algicola sp.]|nr:histidine phosphatase family protein [Algicola sp.]